MRCCGGSGFIEERRRGDGREREGGSESMRNSWLCVVVVVVSPLVERCVGRGGGLHCIYLCDCLVVEEGKRFNHSMMIIAEIASLRSSGSSSW